MPAKNDLMDQLAAPENLLAAWRAVRGNIPRYRRQRSAGPDGITLTEFERDLPLQLQTLRHMLLHQRYQPQAPGLFTIAKRSGGTRQIALLNVADRVAQRATQQVIEPLYEPGFLPCNFGFRPGRSIQDAVYCVRRMRSSGYAWVVDGDIAACFDTLDHQLLLRLMQKKVTDPRVLDLLRAWLEVGILEHGLPSEKSGWLEESWRKAGDGLRQGAEWAANFLARSPEPLDDFYSAPMADRFSPRNQAGYSTRYAQPAYLDEEMDTHEDESNPGQNGFPVYPVPEEGFSMNQLQQQALREMAAGGLVFGARWARGALAKAGPAALAMLKSPAGRILLKRVLLTGGGALGAAVGVAVTAGLVYRQVAPVPVGVMQGSPLSPLLANVYLDRFDVALTRAGYRLVRYADDWVILCPDQDSAETGYNRATIALSRLRLKLNPGKTRILPPSEPLEWLGVTIA